MSRTDLSERQWRELEPRLPSDPYHGHDIQSFVKSVPVDFERTIEVVVDVQALLENFREVRSPGLHRYWRPWCDEAYGSAPTCNDHSILVRSQRNLRQSAQRPVALERLS